MWGKISKEYDIFDISSLSFSFYKKTDIVNSFISGEISEGSIEFFHSNFAVNKTKWKILSVVSHKR